MNSSYTGENGGTKEVSGKTESRWRISTDVRNALAQFVGAVTLLAAVRGVCESSVSRLSERFDQQDRELERIGRRLDWIESTTAEGFRQANDRVHRADTRIDRLEAKVDKIESLLIERRLRVPVEGD